MTILDGVESPHAPSWSTAGGSPRWGAAAQSVAKPLTVLPLVALIFYDVSGGPFGIEDAVRTGTPLLALLGFLVLPIAWSVPEAMVTAELATAFPENSGFVAWVTAAYGPWWGWMEGWFKWLSGVTDNAIYPVSGLLLRTEARSTGGLYVFSVFFFTWHVFFFF
jgi:amino acid transporter